MNVLVVVLGKQADSDLEATQSPQNRISLIGDMDGIPAYLVPHLGG